MWVDVKSVKIRWGPGALLGRPTQKQAARAEMLSYSPSTWTTAPRVHLNSSSSFLLPPIRKDSLAVQKVTQTAPGIHSGTFSYSPGINTGEKYPNRMIFQAAHATAAFIGCFQSSPGSAPKPLDVNGKTQLQRALN